MAKSEPISGGCAFGFLFLIAVVFLGGFLAICFGLSSCGHNSDTTATNTTSPADSRIQIGDEGQIYDDTGSAYVATTQEAEIRLTDFENAGRAGEITKMLEAGDVYLVDTGTKAKVLGYGDGVAGADIYNIQITGAGHHLYDQGWVPRLSMKK